MNIALGYLLTFGWVFLVLSITLGLKRVLHLGDETSRKIVHIAVAFAWLPMAYFHTSWHLVVPPLVMTILNYISYRTGLFSSMERTDEEKRSPGTVYYALSMTVMAVVCVLLPGCLPAYGAALFCMALGDGLAPLFGAIRPGNRTLFRGRTLYGSIAVFVICLLVLGYMNRYLIMHLQLPALLCTAAAATVLELVGVHGLDNLTLPLGVFTLLLFLMGVF